MITTAQLPAAIAIAHLLTQIPAGQVHGGRRLTPVQVEAQELLSRLTDQNCADNPEDGVHNMLRVVSDGRDRFGRRVRVVTCTCGQAKHTETFPRS